MRIMITGAAGRLGRRVVDAAATAGHSVIACDREVFEAGPQVQSVITDVTDYDAVRGLLDGVDAVIHLAAWAGPQPGWPRTHHDNVTGSYSVLLAAAEAGVTRVCAASSVNAIGGIYSRTPRFDYFPIDVAHPTYAEDPYSLSKWILEEQARSLARRFPSLSVASLRFSAIMEREARAAHIQRNEAAAAPDLWGYSPPDACAEVCLAALTADVRGAEVFYVVADRTASEVPSEELARRYFPDTPIRGDLSGQRGFYDCSPARDRLDWTS